MAGGMLALTVLVPCETSHDGSRFISQLARDLSPASLWVLLAPAVVGVGLLLGTFAHKRAVSLGILALASIAGLLLVMTPGMEALAWDALPAPEIWSFGPGPSLFAVSFSAVGVCLYPAIGTRRAARGVLLAGAVCAVAHLVLPVAGEAPLGMTARVIAHVARNSGWGNVLSASVLSLIVLWPATAVAAGWVHARRLAVGPRSLMGVLAAYSLPTLLRPIAQRLLANPWSGSGDSIPLMACLVTTAPLLVVVATATSFLAESPPSWREWRSLRGTILASLAAVVLLALATSMFAHPSRRAIVCRLEPPTATGDLLFGSLLPSWNDARKRVDLDGSDAPDAAEEQALVVAKARELDGRLGAALAALLTESAGKELMERRWYRLVDEVNAAGRSAGLPYYVDPTEVVVSPGDPPRRWFRIDTYRIEEVGRFAHEGRELAALRVRAMSQDRRRLAAMGISRDLEPFAVVVLDEIDAYQEDLEHLAAQVPPRCGETPASSPEAEDALRACGNALAAWVQDGSLRATLLLATERHELQHQIDGPSTLRSGWLAPRIAWQAPEERARIERELSAYLAQMTASGVAPRLTLLRLLRMALLVRGGVEHEVARLAFEALSGDEGTRGRGVGAEAYANLDKLDDAVLRAKAAETWRRVYGRELGIVARP